MRAVALGGGAGSGRGLGALGDRLVVELVVRLEVDVGWRHRYIVTGGRARRTLIARPDGPAGRPR